MRIAVCVKQVPDPDIPQSQFKVDEGSLSVVPPTGVPPVVNGFDLNAAEAAIQLAGADSSSASEITIISAGHGFMMDVMKKPLAMGAHRLVLVDDPLLSESSATGTVRVLAAAIRKTGPYDLILCGRQASDWDQAHVPMGLAEALESPCITVARGMARAGENMLHVDRALEDGYQTVETTLPAVVTVSNEFGEPRYPTLRGIMAATRNQPITYSLADVGVDPAELASSLRMTRIFEPERGGECEIIEGDDAADAGRRLAIRLRAEQLI